MLLKFLVIIFELLLLSFLIGLPLFKRRPIFIKTLSLGIIVLFAFSLLALFVFPFVYIVGLFLAIIFFYLQSPWIIFGLTREQLQKSWSKSLMMTRTSGSEITISFRTFGWLSIVVLPKINDKKIKLVKNLFRKLIENHYIFSSK